MVACRTSSSNRDRAIFRHRTNDDAHVIVFPGVGYVRQIFIRTVEVNVVIVVAFEKRADVE